MKAYVTVLICLMSWQSMSAQAYPDRHSTSWNDAWVSCEAAVSPNVKRDPGHWIMYDLGDQYALHESTFWNNNVPGETDRGLNEIIIDVSNDGVEWTELGSYNMVQGPASAFYQGDEGPDFGGQIARYVLISALSNHGGDCYSLSEVRINAAITTTTSFFENELDLNLTVSPNPAIDIATVTVDNLPSGTVKYQVTSAAGRLYSTGTLNSNSVNIDVSNMPTGIYTLTVYNENGLKSQLFNVIGK